MEIQMTLSEMMKQIEAIRQAPVTGPSVPTEQDLKLARHLKWLRETAGR